MLSPFRLHSIVAQLALSMHLILPRLYHVLSAHMHRRRELDLMHRIASHIGPLSCGALAKFLELLAATSVQTDVLLTHLA